MNIEEYSSGLSTLLQAIRDCSESNGYSISESVKQLCEERVYIKDEQVQFFERIKIVKTVDSTTMVHYLSKKNLLGKAREFKLVNDNDYFILEDRYIVPVYTINNHLVSLIGWVRGTHDTKYITLPSPYLNKNLDWFALHYALENYLKLDKNKYILVVEGIFDALSMNAIGVPTVATMGADVSYSKTFMLQPFKRVLYMPDNDYIGKSNLRKWKFYNVKSTSLDLRGEIYLDEDNKEAIIRAKDSDNLASYLDSEGLKELFLEVAQSNRLNVCLNLNGEIEI